jgi:hypothetical protein
MAQSVSGKMPLVGSTCGVEIGGTSGGLAEPGLLEPLAEGKWSARQEDVVFDALAKPSRPSCAASEAAARGTNLEV